MDVLRVIQSLGNFSQFFTFRKTHLVRLWEGGFYKNATFTSKTKIEEKWNHQFKTVGVSFIFPSQMGVYWGRRLKEQIRYLKTKTYSMIITKLCIRITSVKLNTIRDRSLFIGITMSWKIWIFFTSVWQLLNFFTLECRMLNLFLILHHKLFEPFFI